MEWEERLSVGESGDRRLCLRSLRREGILMAASPSWTPPPGLGCSIHWFRRGLRLHDNPALQAAIRNGGSVRCIYILDPWFAASSSVGINRWR